MTQNQIADVLSANGLNAFASAIRAASGHVSLADGTTEPRVTREIRSALTQIERDYLPGMQRPEVADGYARAIAALRSAEATS